MAGGRVRWLALTVSLMPLLSQPVQSSAISTAAARGAVDSCIGRLNPETDIGYERVAARCPDLARRLDAAGLSAWLPRNWEKPGNDLSSAGLRELGNLLALEDRDSAAVPARVHQPNISHLPAILAGLAGGDPAEGRGWWTRTKAWLRDVFEHREEEDDSWFSRVVGQNGLSQAVIDLVSYVALALVVVLALVIVTNEVRVDGVLGRLWRRFFIRRRVAVPVEAEREGAAGVVTWDALHQAAPEQRPRMLLEIIAFRLTEEGRLPQARGLTVGELTRLARLPDEADRRRLAELARVSERMRFSNEPVPDTAVGAVLEEGRILLQRLSVPPDGLQA
jgi:hypothetical protein